MKSPIYNKQGLLDALQDYIDRTGIVPDAKDLINIPELASKNTYVRNFKGYNNALLELGFKPKKVQKLDCLEKTCNYCSTEYHTKREHSLYCSRRCACLMSAEIRKEYNEPTLCDECGEEHERTSKFCSNLCRIENFMKSQTIDDISLYEQQNRYRAIRGYAHSFFNHYGKPDKCQVCDYSLHVELCHIKAINNFDSKDNLWECNKPENIVFLCRNCHWEFDNGYIDIGNMNAKNKP